ncbi:MAG: GntR family transcriptional regulator [Lentisphaerota bacterium]
MGVINKSTLVYEDLRNSIQSGEYAVGANLPNEIVFSKQLGISRQTLRLALDQLEKEKLIVRYKHRGTFVHRKSYKEKTISVVVPRAGYVDKASFHSWFVAQYILEGVFGQARDAGMNIGIQYLYPDDHPLNESVDILLKDNASGYVFPSLGGNAAIIKELVRRGRCAVVRHWCQLDYAHTVSVKYREAVRLAIKYLINSGRRKIVFFGPSRKNVEDIGLMERYWGYKDAMDECGLPVTPELYRICGSYSDEAHAATLQMLADGVRPDAIFCGTDLRAFGSMKALRESNIRVPEDIALLGFDNLPECEKVVPQLSTIDSHLCRSGELMCDIIKEAIDHPETGLISRTLDCDFIKRDSC